MKSGNTRKGLAVLTAVAIIGFGAYAFAGRGMGYGSGHPGMGGGRGMGNWACPMADLSDADAQKLSEERQAFFSATQGLRDEIYQKRLALESEIAKTAPDIEAASKLQAELSALKGQMDLKRVEHLLQMKKINPNAGRGFFRRSGMGRGARGGGYCGR